MINVRYVVCITNWGEKDIMNFQTMLFINYSHATRNIKYVLIYIDRVYETFLLKLGCHKINSVSGISWLIMALFSSSNYLEDGPRMLIIMYDHTVVANVYLNHELVHFLPFNGLSMVLQQTCAPGLEWTYTAPTHNNLAF